MRSYNEKLKCCGQVFHSQHDSSWSNGRHDLCYECNVAHPGLIKGINKIDKQLKHSFEMR